MFLKINCWNIKVRKQCELCGEWSNIKWFFKHMSEVHQALFCRCCREYLPKEEHKVIKLTKLTTVVVTYINTMKTTFYLIMISTNLSDSRETWICKQREVVKLLFVYMFLKNACLKALFINKSSSLYWYNRRPL